MTTVADGVLAVARRLPGTVRGVATGGGETGGVVYVDDTRTLARFDDDALIGGALLIETGDLAGAILTISDNTQSTGRALGVEQVWTREGSETPAAGDVYTVTWAMFGPAELLAAVAEAVQTWGRVEQDASLGATDGTTRTFSLPVGVTGAVVRLYAMHDETGRRVELFDWEDTDGGIETGEAIATGWTLSAVVVYQAETNEDTTDTLPDEILLDWVGWSGVMAVLRAGIGPGTDRDLFAQLMNYAADKAAEVQARAPHGPRARERLAL